MLGACFGALLFFRETQGLFFSSLLVFLLAQNKSGQITSS